MTKRHKLRFARNLLISALLALFLWYVNGCPLPTREMEMHREERQVLAEESRVVWSWKNTSSLSNPDLLVGVTRDSVRTYPGLSNVWPRNISTPTLVPMYRPIQFFARGGLFNVSEALVLVAVDPPPQAETARLTLDLGKLADRPLGDKLRYTVEIPREGDVFPFFVKKEHDTPSDPLCDEEDTAFSSLSFLCPDYMPLISYTLEFYDAGGASVGTYTG